MNINEEQFVNTLKRVVKDEVDYIKDNMATRKQVEDLNESVDDLAKKVDSYLNDEWSAHLHDTHPRLENRLSQIERKLNH